MTASRTTTALGPAAAIALGLAACSPAPDETVEKTELGTIEDASGTLASVLADMENSSMTRRAVEEGGLASLLDGSGTYTLLAPEDAAFETLGEEGRQLFAEEQRPLLVGILREHILPGHITPEAIRTAIQEKGGGEVRMTTLGGGSVVFSQEGDGITVTDSGGTAARFTGNALAASNGTVIPIDAVLVPRGSEAPAGQ